jgi:hypothetical protein
LFDLSWFIEHNYQGNTERDEVINYLLATVNAIQDYSQVSLDKYANKPQVDHTK